MPIGSEIRLSSSASRYGHAVFVIQEKELKIYNGGSEFVVESINPRAEAEYYIEQFKFKERPRVYVNKPLADLIDKDFKYFHIEGENVFFHNNPKFYRTNGSVLRSGKTVELSFFMPHSLLKKKQVTRFHLELYAKSDVYIVFKVIHEELVWWKSKDKRSVNPVITIG